MSVTTFLKSHDQLKNVSIFSICFFAFPADGCLEKIISKEYVRIIPLINVGLISNNIEPSFNLLRFTLSSSYE